LIDHHMPDAAYHERPELSSTGARSLLPEFGGSPAKYQWNRTHPRSSKPYDIGHAVHARVLGTGLQAIAYPEELLAANGAASTKAAKDWANEQRANGLVPMKEVEVNVIRKISDAVLAHPEARQILETSAHRETSIFTQSPEGVAIRARFDIYSDTIAADLKTTTDASPRAFLRHIVDYGYHVQEAWYRDAHRYETGSELDSFKFVAVETSGPYQVAVHELDILFQRIGTELAKRARDTYAECMSTGLWPGINGELIGPPQWMVYQYEDEMAG
jgi:exodeoxyribonuclease VIII